MTDVPENCPGTSSEQAGKAAACAGCPNQASCQSGEAKQSDPDIAAITERMMSVAHKIIILSGKGGVGKSAVATNLAKAIALDPEKQVGLLDLDICGPSQARMLGAEDECVHESGNGWSPIALNENFIAMSIAFLIENRNDAIIWRGARKNTLIKQFLKDVDWGALDYLIIDMPPGTSDEHISAVQLLVQSGGIDGALIVTTPQEMSLLDVRKEITFCRKTTLKVLGVIENMSSYMCPCCSTLSALFPKTSGGAEKMCKELAVPLIASLPFDPLLAECADKGEDFIELYRESPTVKQFLSLAELIIKSTQSSA